MHLIQSFYNALLVHLDVNMQQYCVLLQKYLHIVILLIHSVRRSKIIHFNAVR